MPRKRKKFHAKPSLSCGRPSRLCPIPTFLAKSMRNAPSVAPWVSRHRDGLGTVGSVARVRVAWGQATGRARGASKTTLPAGELHLSRSPPRRCDSARARAALQAAAPRAGMNSDRLRPVLRGRDGGFGARRWREKKGDGLLEGESEKRWIGWDNEEQSVLGGRAGRVRREGGMGERERAGNYRRAVQGLRVKPAVSI